MKRLVEDICIDTYCHLIDYNNEVNDWYENLCGGCAVGARIIQLTGKRLGYKTTLVAGKFKPSFNHSHCWTIWEHYLVDPTASQYGRRPWVSSYEYKYLYEPWIVGPAAVRELNNKWEEKQRLKDHIPFIEETVQALTNHYRRYRQ
jgi:hypothetical protein